MRSGGAKGSSRANTESIQIPNGMPQLPWMAHDPTLWTEPGGVPVLRLFPERPVQLQTDGHFLAQYVVCSLLYEQ